MVRNRRGPRRGRRRGGEEMEEETRKRWEARREALCVLARRSISDRGRRRVSPRVSLLVSSSTSNIRGSALSAMTGNLGAWLQPREVSASSDARPNVHFDLLTAACHQYSAQTSCIGWYGDFGTAVLCDNSEPYIRKERRTPTSVRLRRAWCRIRWLVAG